jgi:DNA-binding transcriptional MocR family regulator
MYHGVDPDGIFVGNGSLQVLDLLTAYLLHGDPAAAGRTDVLVEAPCYDRALGIFARHGGRCVGLPVQADGLDVADLERRVRTTPPAFLYTIPDFQNPSGVTMGEPKRRAVVELADRYGFRVVEDTPYRALRYRGVAPPSLLSIAGARGPVIAVGSLSKTLSPGLRVGYAIARESVATALAHLAEAVYLSPPPLCQAVAARCLSSGLVGENVARVCDLLRPRHDAAVEAVRAHLGEAALSVPDGGYFVSIYAPAPDVGAGGEASLLRAARAAGLVLTAGSGFYPPGAAPPPSTVFLRLPFQALDPADFASGLRRLAALV